MSDRHLQNKLFPFTVVSVLFCKLDTNSRFIKNVDKFYRSNSTEVSAGLYSCSSSKAASSVFPNPFFLSGSLYSVASKSMSLSLVSSRCGSSCSSWGDSFQL